MTGRIVGLVGPGNVQAQRRDEGLCAVISTLTGSSKSRHDVQEAVWRIDNHDLKGHRAKFRLYFPLL